MSSKGIFTSSDGLSIAYDRWAGRTPSLLLIHATGFCKELWRPVVSAAGGAHCALAFDQRGHGDSETSPPPQRWAALGRDAGAAASLLDGPVLGVGHSSGGAALCLAEAASPRTFAGLVLIEPIVFPGPHRRVEDNEPSALALKRRARFTSREEARSNFARREPFSRWTEEMLVLYVEHALRPQGEGFVLKCAPEVEADFYREGLNHGAWEQLGVISCPVIVLAGEHSDTHEPPFVDRLTARFSNARSRIVPDTSHLLPMERPDVVAESIAELVAT